MKFYSALLAIPLMAVFIMPRFASFKGNPPQKIAATEQVNLPTEKVFPPTEPEPHRGQGRR